MRRLVGSRHSIPLALAGLAIVVLVLAVGATGASATVRFVDSAGGGDFTTIQDAVDAADPGDTIVVRYGNTGDYTECVELNVAGLVVVTAGGVSILDDGCEYIVKITADTVRFQGFVVDGDSCTGCGGIKIAANSAQVLTNYVRYPDGDGIHVGNAGATPAIKNNILSNNLVENCDGSGIYLDQSSKASQVFGNVVRNCDSDGLHIESRDNVITSNWFTYNDGDGIDIDIPSAWNNKFTDNVAADNYDHDFEQATGVSGTKLSGNVFPNSCTNC